MVSNVEADHLEHYETLDRLEDAFAEVVRRVDGPVVVGVDDPGGRRLAQRTSRPTFGTGPGADWNITDVQERRDSVLLFFTDWTTGMRSRSGVQDCTPPAMPEGCWHC